MVNTRIEYGKEVTVRPAHFDVPFFIEILENAVRSAKVEISQIRITMGSNVGDNYCSRIYRVRIEYRMLIAKGGAGAGPTGELHCLPVIIKSVFNLDSAAFLQDLQVYLKEKITYSELLPRLEILFDKPKKFGPKLYHNLKLPENTLVFEDLGHDGYGLASRETGLNERHCQLVVQRLAEFHAASLALVKKDPNIFATYHSGLLSKAALDNNGWLMQFISGNAHQLHNVVSSWPGFESTTQKIQRYIDNLYQNLIDSQAPKDNGFKVLNHGDLWVNNMLFKYADDNDEDLKDVIFIDFQMGIWGSPGIDLNYFFYTSMSLDVLKNKRGELIKIYHETLCSTLRSLGLSEKAPSHEQILKEVHCHECYGFFANFAVFPTISQDKNERNDNNLENFADEEFAKKKLAQIFSSRRLAETLKYTLKYFEDAGVLT